MSINLFKVSIMRINFLSFKTMFITIVLSSVSQIRKKIVPIYFSENICINKIIFWTAKYINVGTEYRFWLIYIFHFVRSQKLSGVRRTYVNVHVRVNNINKLRRKYADQIGRNKPNYPHNWNIQKKGNNFTRSLYPQLL